MVQIEPEDGIKGANLHEHFPEDDIIVILEHCAEDNSYSVFLSLDIPEAKEKTDKHRWDISRITSFVQPMQTDRNKTEKRLVFPIPMNLIQ